MILERKTLPGLIDDINRPWISIIIGARQTGKTTLLNEIIKKSPSQALYLNLENPFHFDVLREGYKSLRQEIESETAMIVIDEFHYYKNITSVFKAFYDLHPGIKIFASGSSSLEIHRHLKESLAGRMKKTILYPLSFEEWLTQFGAALPENSLSPLPVALRQEIDKQITTFIRFGSLPGLVHLRDETEMREYLSEMYQAYIQKDIKTFLKEESIFSFNKLTHLLALHSGQQLNLNQLSKACGLNMRQIRRQIEILSATFVIHILPPFHNNRRKELSKLPKVYFYDTGMANAISRDFRRPSQRPDGGALLETFVYHEIKKSLDASFDLFYWRTADKKEVDFVLVKDRQPVPVEVKSNWSEKRIPMGLRQFLNVYPETQSAVVINHAIHDKIMVDGREIFFLPPYYASKLVNLF
ncbi:MAG: ATP-binding protein [bacterium]